MNLTEEMVVSVLRDVKPQEGDIVRYAVDNMLIDGMYLANLFDDRGFDFKETIEFHVKKTFVTMPRKVVLLLYFQ